MERLLEMSFQGLEELVAHVRSGIVHLIIYRGKERLRSGTGFFVSRKLVVPYSIALQMPRDARLAVRFHDTPPAHGDYSFSREQIQAAICGASDETADDYAILDLPDLLEPDPFQFKFAELEPRIGQSVAFLGYALEHWCLTCHSSTVSAIYSRGDATILQLDGGMNPSTIGGPLLDDNGEVLGILRRETTPLTSAVDNLLQSLDRAISVLSEANFFASTSQAMVAIQQEIKGVARQIERSESAGMGFALACQKIKNEIVWSGAASARVLRS
jgi:hypothetical protein